MEILQITSAIVGIKNAIDIAKAIKDSSASLEKAEINFKIAELINALADAKIGIATIQEAMAEKDSEIKRLKTELETRRNMVWESPYYFLKNEEGKDGPYCQKCYDSNRKLIRLQLPGSKGLWVCNECDSRYKDSNYVEIAHVSMQRRERFIHY